jgi:TonB family protein
MILLGSLLLVSALGAAAQLPAPSPPPPRPSACVRALTDAAAGEMCLGEQAGRLASGAPKQSAERTRQLEAAADHYRRAAALARVEATVRAALELVAESYDAQHLNDPKRMEQALRELIRATPGDLVIVSRLARLQEDQGLDNAAEETLLDARYQYPDKPEPYRMLAQFYARRVTALNKQQSDRESPSAGAPGESDQNGVYRVGGAVTPPQRLGTPQYPPEARAAGIQGVVIAEVVIDPFGNVTDAKVLRSIPLLDEPALKAVRDWHYAPTVVNGQPVPVRMTVTVNFTLPPSSPPAPTPTPSRR